jgi:hypothetical protein
VFTPQAGDWGSGKGNAKSVGTSQFSAIQRHRRQPVRGPILLGGRLETCDEEWPVVVQL